MAHRHCPRPSFCAAIVRQGPLGYQALLHLSSRREGGGSKQRGQAAMPRRLTPAKKGVDFRVLNIRPWLASLPPRPGEQPRRCWMRCSPYEHIVSTVQKTGTETGTPIGLPRRIFSVETAAAEVWEGCTRARMTEGTGPGRSRHWAYRFLAAKQMTSDTAKMRSALSHTRRRANRRTRRTGPNGHAASLWARSHILLCDVAGWPRCPHNLFWNDMRQRNCCLVRPANHPQLFSSGGKKALEAE